MIESVKDYWNNRYLNMQTGWDIGHVSTPIKDWLDKQTNKELKILIPGAGNAYEAEYAYQKEFKNITVIDIAPQAIVNIKKRVPSFPKEQLILGDFFKLEGKYDIVIEQTFFCALNPVLRKAYVKKMSELLGDKGRLIGLLFNFPLESGPPFGGSEKEYRALFMNYFEIKTIKVAQNSIKPRLGKELWVEFIVK